MTKAEKIVRDLLNDRCSTFKFDYLGHNNCSDNHFNLSFQIPPQYIVYIDLKALRTIVDAFNIDSVYMQPFNKGFRVDLNWLSPAFKANVSTVEGVRLKQDTSVGPVRCKTCNDVFKTLADALQHVELVHRGDVELDNTFIRSWE